MRKRSELLKLINEILICTNLPWHTPHLELPALCTHKSGNREKEKLAIRPNLMPSLPLSPQHRTATSFLQTLCSDLYTRQATSSGEAQSLCRHTVAFKASLEICVGRLWNIKTILYSIPLSQQQAPLTYLSLLCSIYSGLQNKISDYWKRCTNTRSCTIRGKETTERKWYVLSKKTLLSQNITTLYNLFFH